MAKIELPSVLTEETWFYKDNEDILKKFLGKPYISYSTETSFTEYFEDFVKQKLAKIKLPSSVYAEFGSWAGEYVETGEKVLDTDFGGSDNLDLIPREEGAVYERPVVIDYGDFFLIGFIDIFKEENGLVSIVDLKTGGKNKEAKYKSDDYIQVLLYAYAVEEEGYKIGECGVYFCRRTGSHFKPPLTLSEEQFFIPIEYNRKKAEKAVKKVEQTAKKISDLYKTYKRFF